jgi:hypothetical protein
VREEVPDRELITGWEYGFRRTPRSFDGDRLIAAEMRRRGMSSSAVVVEQSALLTTGRLEEALQQAFEVPDDPTLTLLLLLPFSVYGPVPGDPRVRAAVATDPCPTTWGCFVAAILAADMGDWERHDQALGEYDRLVQDRIAGAAEAEDPENDRRRWESERPWIEVARDYGRVKRGEVDGVPRSYDAARTAQPWANWPANSRGAALTWWTAEALLANGRAEQAVRYYESMWGSPHGGWYTLRMVGLGDALRATGRPDEARTQYQEFLDTWSAADPDQPLVQRARAGLEALGG